MVKRYVPIFIFLAVTLPIPRGFGQAPDAGTTRVSAEQAHWKSRLALLKPGMTREQVQKILSEKHGTFTPHNGDNAFTDFEGGGNSTAYWLDDDWMIHPWYDYHGKPYSPGEMTGPQNGLLHVPSLERRRLPLSGPHKGPSVQLR